MHMCGIHISSMERLANSISSNTPNSRSVQPKGLSLPMETGILTGVIIRGALYLLLKNNSQLRAEIVDYDGNKLCDAEVVPRPPNTLSLRVEPQQDDYTAGGYKFFVGDALLGVKQQDEGLFIRAGMSLEIVDALVIS